MNNQYGNPPKSSSTLRPAPTIAHNKSASTVTQTASKTSLDPHSSSAKKTSKPTDGPTNISTTSVAMSQNHVSNVRDKFISLELNNLKSYGYFYGIYCVPRHFKSHVWDGIIMIRSGLYKNAKFKFYMEFPRGFPKNKPEVYFVSKVYHPLINYETGHLDLKLLSPDWKGNSTISFNLFAWLKAIFHDTTYLQVTDSFNPKAGTDFLENIEAFYESVCACIDQSEKDLYENEPSEGLKFHPYNAVHEVIQKKLGDVVANKDIPDSLRVSYFIDALLQNAKSSE